MDHTEANEHNRNHNPLNQKTDTGPSAGKCGIKPLQSASLAERKAIAKTTKRSKVGSFFLLLASIELDNAAFQTNGYRVGPIVGGELRQNIGNAALDSCLAD